MQCAQLGFDKSDIDVNAFLRGMEPDHFNSLHSAIKPLIPSVCEPVLGREQSTTIFLRMLEKLYSVGSRVLHLIKTGKNSDWLVQNMKSFVRQCYFDRHPPKTIKI